MPNTKSVVRPKGNFSPDKFIMPGQLVKQPGLEGGGQGTKAGSRAWTERELDLFGDLEISIPSLFGFQGVESLGSHDHDLARPVSLGNFKMRVVAGCPEVSWRRPDCRHPAYERGIRIEGAETNDHFLVQFVGEVEHVSGVGIQNENNLHSKMLGAPGHPLEHPLEAAPVREPIFERKQSGYAQPRSGSAIKQLLFSGFGPSGVAPRSGRRKFGWIGNHHGIIYWFSRALGQGWTN